MIFYVLAPCYKGSENLQCWIFIHCCSKLHQVALNISFKRMFSNHHQRYCCSFPKGNTGHVRRLTVETRNKAFQFSDYSGEVCTDLH